MTWGGGGGAADAPPGEIEVPVWMAAKQE